MGFCFNFMTFARELLFAIYVIMCLNVFVPRIIAEQLRDVIILFGMD